MKLHRPAAMVVVVDALLATLLLLSAILALSTIQRKVTPPSIVTLGIYAIVVQWPNNNPDDVDTYVEDPQDHIVYFANPTAGLMNLEHDNLGAIGETEDDGTKIVKNKYRNERVILRGVIPGEYTVNVHMFAKRSNSPTPVTITLVRLVGGAKVIIKRTVVLVRESQQLTAFRFTLNQGGYVTSTSTLFKNIVYSNTLTQQDGGVAQTSGLSPLGGPQNGGH
jgi:hypothetical protein